MIPPTNPRTGSPYGQYFSSSGPGISEIGNNGYINGMIYKVETPTDYEIKTI